MTRTREADAGTRQPGGVEGPSLNAQPDTERDLALDLVVVVASWPVAPVPLELTPELAARRDPFLSDVVLTEGDLEELTAVGQRRLRGQLYRHPRRTLQPRSCASSWHQGRVGRDGPIRRDRPDRRCGSTFRTGRAGLVFVDTPRWLRVGKSRRCGLSGQCYDAT